MYKWIMVFLLSISMVFACEGEEKSEETSTEENSESDDTQNADDTQDNEEEVVETKAGSCNGGYCYWSCSSDSDCPLNQSTCTSNGYCVLSCDSDSDCYGDDTCSNGYCLTACSDDSECDLE